MSWKLDNSTGTDMVLTAPNSTNMTSNHNLSSSTSSTEPNSFMISQTNTTASNSMKTNESTYRSPRTHYEMVSRVGKAVSALNNQSPGLTTRQLIGGQDHISPKSISRHNSTDDFVRNQNLRHTNGHRGLVQIQPFEDSPVEMTASRAFDITSLGASTTSKSVIDNLMLDQGHCPWSNYSSMSISPSFGGGPTTTTHAGPASIIRTSYSGFNLSRGLGSLTLNSYNDLTNFNENDNGVSAKGLSRTRSDLIDRQNVNHQIFPITLKDCENNNLPSGYDNESLLHSNLDISTIFDSSGSKFQTSDGTRLRDGPSKHQSYVDNQHLASGSLRLYSSVIHPTMPTGQAPTNDSSLPVIINNHQLNVLPGKSPTIVAQAIPNVGHMFPAGQDLSDNLSSNYRAAHRDQQQTTIAGPHTSIGGGRSDFDIGLLYNNLTPPNYRSAYNPLNDLMKDDLCENGIARPGPGTSQHLRQRPFNDSNAYNGNTHHNRKLGRRFQAPFFSSTKMSRTKETANGRSSKNDLYNMMNYMNNSDLDNNGDRYSRKVFVGGLPPDIDEEEIKTSFRRFGSLLVDWPHKAESKSYFPPKGYAFLLFHEGSSVQNLIDSCLLENGKLYLCVSSPTIKDKPVQIRPWKLGDADFVLDSTLPLDPRKTVFVGGVPRPLKASELANIMNNLYGGVCYAGIDTDPELKYPKGAGRVAFSNHQSYIAAISARFVHLQLSDIDKRVEVKPYVLDDQICDECQGSKCNNKFAPFFCANIVCLRYYCENCWSTVHSQSGREHHKPLVKEGADKPRAIPFNRW